MEGLGVSSEVIVSKETEIERRVKLVGNHNIDNALS